MRYVLLVGAFAGVAAWAQVTASPAPPADQQPAAQSPTAPPPTASPSTASPSTASPPTAPPPGGQQPDSAAVQSSMADSIAKQRAAVMKQVAGVMGKAPTPAASFFTVPWVQTPVPFSTPPCDPMPAPELDKLVEQNSQQEGV